MKDSERSRFVRRSALALALMSLTSPAWAGCLGAGVPKGNNLYLMFANAATPYLEFGQLPNSPTSPAQPFALSGIPSYAGTAADLQTAVTSVVEMDFCEFNVKVHATNAFPPTALSRRNIVAVTTQNAFLDGLLSKPQRLDTGDLYQVDYSYVYGGTFQSWLGGSGGALNGINSTLTRWANALGGSAALAAANNYGVSNSTTVRPGEDSAARHIMSTGSAVTPENRVGYRRHFSDTSFSVLASNVGLSFKTMWNWDLVNPNAQTAHALEMTVLYPSATPPVIGWYYGQSPAECHSPWKTPTVTGPTGPAQAFHDGIYYPYTVRWDTPNPYWGNGPCAGATGAPGQAIGGAYYHIGATFTDINPNTTVVNALVVKDIRLYGATNNLLSLKPRLHGLDAGTFDPFGSFRLSVFNLADAATVLRNVELRELPRVVGLNEMVVGGRIADANGEEFQPWNTRTLVREAKFDVGQSMAIPVAKVGQQRHVSEVITAEDCQRQRAGDAIGDPAPVPCTPRVNVDLFPSTTLYLTADTVEPNATFWDAKQRKYVTGPLSTRTYYQVTGRRLDQNRNGVDDFVDAHAPAAQPK
ncbi:hypothetical protein PRJ39_18050 [Lysobacter enzymogenes]|uniref:hypothetical protein n=1 Tax=Lysobacter enzymogenes TaxID=69 RepID=UPI00374783DB